MSQVLSDKKNCPKKRKTTKYKELSISVCLEQFNKLFTVYRRSNIAIAQSYILGLLKCDKNHTNMERMVEAMPEQEYHQYHHFLSESKWDHVAVNKQTAQSVSAFMSTCKTKNKLPTGLIIDES